MESIPPEHWPLIGAMIQQVKERLRIDWTIPAVWVIGLTIAMLVNLGAVIWKGAAIITTLDAVVADLQRNHTELERIRDRQVVNEIEIGRQKQADIELGNRISRVEPRK